LLMCHNIVIFECSPALYPLCIQCFSTVGGYREGRTVPVGSQRGLWTPDLTHVQRGNNVQLNSSW